MSSANMLPDTAEWAGPAAPGRLEADKRHMSFDDAAQEPATLEGAPRPRPFHSARSFQLQPAVNEPQLAQPEMSIEKFEEEMVRAVNFADERRKGPKEPFVSLLRHYLLIQGDIY